MTTMVMSSAIKPSDVIGTGKQSKNRGKLHQQQQQENQEMQWVFLTTTKRRSSVEEQKLVRVDSKHSYNATCLRTENELKTKYSEKWINNSRNKKGGLSRGSNNNRTAASEKFGLKRDRMLSLRLPRRQQSMKDSFLTTPTSEANKISGKVQRCVHLNLLDMNRRYIILIMEYMLTICFNQTISVTSAPM